MGEYDIFVATFAAAVLLSACVVGVRSLRRSRGQGQSAGKLAEADRHIFNRGMRPRARVRDEQLTDLLRAFHRVAGELIESEERYDLAIKASNVGLWDRNLKDGTMFCSPRFREILGVTDSNYVPKFEEFAARLHDDDREMVMSALDAHLRQREPYIIEYRLRHNDGHYIWIHGRGQAVWDEKGEPIRMAGSLEDITATKINAIKLSESEQKFRSAYYYSSIGMTLVAPNGKFLDVNRSLCAILGYDEKELLALDFQTITHPDDLNADLDHLGQLLRREIASYKMEKRFFHKDGRIVWVLLSVSLVLDANGDPNYVVSQIEDITSRKSAERERDELIEKLNRSNRDLETFAYVASHDLKAPLRVIDNASRWLEEDLEEHLVEETRDHLDLLRNRVSRMEKLLDDLLAYSRIGRTEEIAATQRVAGAEISQAITGLLCSPAGFDIRFSETFDEIKTMRMPLQQVLYNLIGNAIKHHDKKNGFVEISAEDLGEFYVFTVRDDGPGVPAEHQAQIFNMFTTLRPRDQVEGSGMGLAIVSKHVETIGGDITLESEEGEGCAFVVRWPKHSAQAGVISNSPQPNGPQTENGDLAPPAETPGLEGGDAQAA